MAATPDKKHIGHHDFVFVGDHPAVDFANTLVISEGRLTDLLSDWTNVISWLVQAGLSAVDCLQIPSSRTKEAIKRIVELRQSWTKEMNRLIAGGKIGGDFLEDINHLLADDFFHETLHRRGRNAFHVDRSTSQLSGEKLALALVARTIAHFLTSANFAYLHRCANTTSCILYFYDTTKNHRRQWCSVATCGNRHKVAQFRKRKAKIIVPG